MFKKSLLLSCLLLSSSLISNASNKILTFTKEQVHVPSRLGRIELVHVCRSFFIKKNDDAILVKNCDMDKKLRNLSNKQLEDLLGGESKDCYRLSEEEVSKLNVDKSEVKVLKGEEAKRVIKIITKSQSSQYIVVKELSDGSYKLTLHGRLPGGTSRPGAQIGYFYLLGKWVFTGAVKAIVKVSPLIVGVTAVLLASNAVTPTSQTQETPIFSDSKADESGYPRDSANSSASETSSTTSRNSNQKGITKKRTMKKKIRK